MACRGPGGWTIAKMAAIVAIAGAGVVEGLHEQVTVEL